MTPPCLSATRDQYYATANIYDASGNRAWKLGGEVNWMWNNGQGWQAYGDLNLRTWYQSDLVTITDQAMTKHYFIAGAALSLSKRQRIASKLAESLAPEVAHALKDKSLTPLSSDLKELGANMAKRIKRDFDCVDLDYNAFYPGEARIEALENLLKTPEQPDEYQLFFYHSDHLGSSSFITDINGDATQHLQYLPFGEDFVHQQNTAAYYTPYTFSGKERDVETNLSYFGARYYEAGLSVWLSVDPMSDEFPHQSPYAYCSNNPVMRIDPDGMYDEPVNGFQRAWNTLTGRGHLNQFADLRQNIEANGLGTVSNVDFSQRGTVSYDFAPNAEAFEMRNADADVDGAAIPVTDNVSTVRLDFGGNSMNTVENYFDVRTDVGGINPLTGAVKGSGTVDVHYVETDVVPQLKSIKNFGKLGAHNPKKQSTGSTTKGGANATRHDKGLRHGKNTAKRGNMPNPNQRKGAENRGGFKKKKNG